jgi:hypothetical protein
MRQLDRAQVEDALRLYNIGRRLRGSLRYDLDAVDWSQCEFITLTNKQRNEGVLFSEVTGAGVIAYQLQRRRAGSSGRTESIICDICMTWQAGSRSATITFEKARGTASFLVCADLACCDHVRNKTLDALISREQLREHISIEARIERLERNLARILS